MPGLFSYRSVIPPFPHKTLLRKLLPGPRLAAVQARSCSGIFLFLSANGDAQKNMAQKQKMCLHFFADRAIITLAVKKRYASLAQSVVPLMRG